MKTTVDFNRVDFIELLVRHRRSVDSGRVVSMNRFREIFLLLRRMTNLLFEGTLLDDSDVDEDKIYMMAERDFKLEFVGHVSMLTVGKKRHALIYTFNLVYHRHGLEAIVSIIHEIAHLKYQTHGLRFFTLMGKMGGEILNIPRLDFLYVMDTIQKYPGLDTAIYREQIWVAKNTRRFHGM